MQKLVWMNCCTSTQRQAALSIHSCVSRAHFPSFLPHQNGGTKINLQLSPFRFLKEPKMQWRRGRSDNAQFNEGRRGKSRNSHDTSSVKRNGFRKGNFRPLSLLPCLPCRYAGRRQRQSYVARLFHNNNCTESFTCHKLEMNESYQ